MRIKTTVKLATFITISVALVYGVFAMVIDRTVASKYRDLRTVSDTRTIFSQLRGVTADYMLYRTDRARQQWWAVQDELLRRLTTPKYQTFQRRYQIEALDSRLELMGQAFTKLTAAVGKTALSPAEAEANQEFQNRLITQILFTSREISTNFDKIFSNISQDVVSLQRRSNWLDVIALFILIAFIVGISIFLSRAVVQPILQLHEGAEIVGRGNLNYRVATAGSGEIQELAQAFNDMTANLMQVTVSRDELAREVEERQKAQEALRESEERFRTMANAIPQLAWIAKSDGYIFWYNQRWHDYTGTTPEEMEGWAWQSVHDPEMLPLVLEQWRASIDTGKPFDMVFPLRGSDGQFRQFLTRVMPMKNADGRVTQWFGTNTDITEQQRAQEALQESEERFRAFMDNSPAIAWAKDEAGRMVYLSKTYEDRFGVRLADWRGKTDFELWPQEIAEEFRKNDLAVLASGHAIEFTEQTINPDGSRCSWWNFKFPFYDAAGERFVGGIAVDITERQKAQAEIERLASFPRLNPHPVLEVDFAGNLNYANPATLEVLKQSGLEEGVSVFLPGDMAAILKEARETGKCEFYREKAIGKASFALFISCPADLNVVRIYSMDITQRKRIEAETELTIKLLRLINYRSSLRELVEDAMKLLQEWSGCEAVGLRLRQGEDFPYFETRGFPAEFVELENSLCAKDQAGELLRDSAGNPVIECMCGNVICGRFNPELAFFTPGGSFWTNSTTQLLGSTSAKDRQARTRNRCHGEGYESVTLVPIKSGQKTLGLLQFNDRTEGKFTREKIQLIERLADNLASGIAQRQAEAALKRTHDELEQRVEERTGELRLAVAQLQAEVTERQQAEQAVRESEQRLRSLASQILTAQERERKRISMELHEGLGQYMTALKMYLRAIQRNLPTQDGDIQEDFAGAQDLLKEMIEEVRRMSRGLSPALLENLGLTAALNRLLDEFSNYQEVMIKVNIDDIQNLFAPQTEISLFRIFQESLNNIAKHARANQVSVTVKRQNGRVNFSIKDNGVGFDRDQLAHEEIADRGMGLASMEERLRMIGTHLNILSQPGQGTEISFSIPTDAI
jgi:PAS domain S-box-containing protein